MENDLLDEDIRGLNSAERLERILRERRLMAFQVFHGLDGEPVVCFTEATQAGLEQLVQVNRYHAWGIGFHKDWVFQQGGGPAFYVRGDMWREFTGAGDLSPRVKAFATKYWPGMNPQQPSPDHPSRRRIISDPVLLRESQWAHEREWRIPLRAHDPIVAFEYSDVVALVAPSREGMNYMKGIADGALSHVREIILTSPLVTWTVTP
jgi:hypothetical protein